MPNGTCLSVLKDRISCHQCIVTWASIEVAQSKPGPACILRKAGQFYLTFFQPWQIHTRITLGLIASQIYTGVNCSRKKKTGIIIMFFLFLRLDNGQQLLCQNHILVLLVIFVQKQERMKLTTCFYFWFFVVIVLVLDFVQCMRVCTYICSFF